MIMCYREILEKEVERIRAQKEESFKTVKYESERVRDRLIEKRG